MATDNDESSSSATPSGEQPGAAADPLVGRRLGDFEVLERIGGGPINAIYRARQQSTDRLVALKVLDEALGGTEFAAARFEAEASAAAAVSHPNVAAIHGWGCEDGRHFMVVELVEGESLADLLARDERLPADRALPLFSQVATALGAVHAAGYIHCGVQPSNVLLAPDGTARLIDFGLARPLDEGLEPGNRGGYLEVPFYYPPEAARARPLDERSDLYQLGGLFYHLLAGQAPFEGVDPEDTALRYARDDVPALGGVLRTAPVALCRLIHRLLSREPDARYQTADEVVEALGRIEAVFTRTVAARRAQAPEPEPRAAEPEPQEPPPRPTIAQRAEAARQQQRRTLIISGAAVGLCVVVAVVMLLVLPIWPTERPPSSFEVQDEPVEPAPAAKAPPKAPATPDPSPPQPPPGPVFLLAANAVIHGKAKYEKGDGKDNIGYWTDQATWVHWDFEAAGPGTYDVRVVFAAERDCKGNLYTVAVGKQQITAKIYDTGGWTEFLTEKIGTMTLERPGTHTLKVRWIKRVRGSALMNLRAVTLRPVKSPTP